MRIEDALEKIKNHKDLLGRYINGARIDELIIVPTSLRSRQQFEKLYISNLDWQISIKTFAKEDVDVLVVFDKKNILERGVFSSTSLDNTLIMLADGNII